MHHAWGMSDLDFTRWFVVAATVVMVAAMAYRFIAFRGRPASNADLDGQYVAFLRGGPRLAVYSALGRLRSAEAVTVDDGGMLARTGPLPRDATRLEAAVYEAATDGHPARDVTQRPDVGAALERIRDDLLRNELLPSPRRLARVRWFRYALLAILGLGGVRIATTLIDGAAVGTLPGAFVLVGLFALLVAFPPTRTRAGSLLLVDARLRHRDHTPGDPAMAIGVFGTPALYGLDPVFAAGIGAPGRRGTSNADGRSGGSV